MLACRLPEDYSESAGVMVENPALEAFTAEEHIMQYPIQQQEAPPLTTQACLSAITQPSSPNYLIFFFVSTKFSLSEINLYYSMLLLLTAH